MKRAIIFFLLCTTCHAWCGVSNCTVVPTGDYYSGKDTVMVGNVIYDIRMEFGTSFSYVEIQNRQNHWLRAGPVDKVSGENYTYLTGYPRAIINSDELAAIASDVFTEQEITSLNAIKDYIAITFAFDSVTYDVLEVGFWLRMFQETSPLLNLNPSRFALFEQKLKESKNLIKWLSVSGYNPTYIRARGHMFLE